jgi:hypothetical protein
MPKKITQVVIAVLISFGLIAAAAPSVQARLGGILQRAESKNAVHMSMNGKALEKHSLQGLAPYQFDDGMDSDHHCGSDPSVDY